MVLLSSMILAQSIIPLVGHFKTINVYNYAVLSYTLIGVLHDITFLKSGTI